MPKTLRAPPTPTTLTRPLPRARREVKKPLVKKPKVTVAEAVILIDAKNLAAHLLEISVRPRQTSRPRRIPVKNEIL
jgi:heme-binding NEAT domain protein